MTKTLEEKALEYISSGETAGHLSIKLTKSLKNAEELSLGYSPGIAYACLAIKKDPNLAYKYTSKGSFVAMISNGTAVLGIGNIGALASKPVMEGKAALLKRFANVDTVDVEVETQDVNEFVNVVKNIGRTWGAINLEDIKAPECFEIETRLQELLDIPVFHDDQHGTAVVVLAAIINSCKITNRKIEDLKITVNGAGAAAIACIELLKGYGVKNDNVILCDTSGIVYKGREIGMNKYKEKHAVNTDYRTLDEALNGADVFLGLSVAGALKPETLLSMNKDPIIFAMANPIPEIMPDVAKSIRSDIIIGTGRSDQANQINNLLCFPYIFRGALDCRATKITTEMKIVAAEVIAQIAQDDKNVSENVKAAYPNKDFTFGKNYIVPTVFDERLLEQIPNKIKEIAIKQGICKKI